MSEFKAIYTAKAATQGWVADFVRPGEAVSEIASFAYNSRFNALANGVSQSNLIQTQADSDFLCTSIAAVTDAPFLIAQPFLTLQITDLSSGKTWFNQAQLLRQVAGAFGMPCQLPVPRVVHPNTNLQITVNVPVAPAGFTALFVSLGGARIYY